VAAAPSAALCEQWTLRPRTRDGVQICVRPLRPDDREREIAFINGLSERSRYFRLLTPLKYLPPHLVDQLMDVDYARRMAFAATICAPGDEAFVGIARYAVTDDPAVAELGVSVADAWQRTGVARLLVQHLLRFAHSRGVRRMTGIVLPENAAMLALARSLGFTVAYDATEHLMKIARELPDPRGEPRARCGEVRVREANTAA
jgi:acetyltransferase